MLTPLQVLLSERSGELARNFFASPASSREDQHHLSIKQVSGADAAFDALRTGSFDLCLIEAETGKAGLLHDLEKLRDSGPLPPLWFIADSIEVEFEAEARRAGAIGCLIRAGLDAEALHYLTGLARGLKQDTPPSVPSVAPTTDTGSFNNSIVLNGASADSKKDDELSGEGSSIAGEDAKGQSHSLLSVEIPTLFLGRTRHSISRNRAAEELAGWSPLDNFTLTGEGSPAAKPEYSLTFPLSNEVLEYLMARAGTERFAEVPHPLEVWVTRRDGSIFPALLSCSPLFDEIGEFSGVAVSWRDIASDKMAEEALRVSEERYALATHGSNAGLWDWNLRNDTVFYSLRWHELLKGNTGLLSDSPNEWLDRIHPDEVERVKSELESHLSGNIPHFESEHRILDSQGVYRWIMMRGVALRDAQGKPYRIAGSKIDITQRKEVEEQLLKNAFFDSLTGLPNRALFLDRLKRMIGRTRRHEHYSFALLFLDLDRFKVVNDSLGHNIGDQLLVEVTRRLEQCIRSNDTFARLGGDEFAILLDDVHEAAEAIQLAERLQAQMVPPLTLEGHEIFTSVSIGIALNNEDNAYESHEDLLRDADTAMYRAKSRGKARHELFDREMHASAFALLKTEGELRRALERQELETFYQPVVCLDTGALSSFEALIRWRHPERGLIAPADFIPVAEEFGLVLPIGEWVIRDVCRQIRQWHTENAFIAGMPTFAINLSSRQFSQTGFVGLVRSIMAEFDIDPHWLQFEITESVLMENATSAALLIREMKEIGLGLAIDDFGTGYSSLASLHQFPLDTLKIDRTFVQRLGEQGENSEIVKSIISLALNLGMTVVAEGIEVAGQLAQLRTLRCDYGQGYFFSMPVPAPDAYRILGAGANWWMNPPWQPDYKTV